MIFLTLIFLETVLGIDNVIFISVLAGRLPEAQRPKARNIGLMLAAVTRILLLFLRGLGRFFTCDFFGRVVFHKFFH